MAPKKENHTKFLVNIPNELLEKVVDYQFEQRCEDRNDAIIKLLKKSLDSNNERDN